MRGPSLGISFTSTCVNKLLNSTADGDGNEHMETQGEAFLVGLDPGGLFCGDARLLEWAFIISN